MADPIDYNAGLNQSLMVGGRLGGLGLQVQQVQMQMRQQEEAQQQARQFQQDWQQAYASGDPKALDSIVAKYPGQMEMVQKAIGFRDDNHRMALGNLARDLRIAAQTGNPSAFAQVVTNNRDVLQSIGSSPEELFTMWQKDPEGTQHIIDTVGMSAMGVKDYYGLQQEKANLAETTRNNDMTSARGWAGQNIAAQRLSLDRQKFTLDIQQAQQKAQDLVNAAPKLSVNMEKSIEKSVTDAAASRNSAASMLTLADTLEKERPTAGLFGNVTNMYAKMTGQDTYLRDIRIRFNQLANSQAIKYLPQGQASDKDIELARKGIPADLDNPEVMARWLRGMAKMEEATARFNEFKSEWISANGNPGQSQRDTALLGMPVRRGESFGQAAKRYMENQSSSLTQNSNAADQQQAPSAALQALQSNPALAEQFKAKYGYLPQGFK